MKGDADDYGDDDWLGVMTAMIVGKGDVDW